ncbi:MAG: GHMP kinase [Euryarchaeota archaeon]|nr:GHMP kinase [Euryarchaeota archaeon]
MTLISRAPVRISFGGGGTDLASYYERHGGMVISASINKYFYTILEMREDDRIQIISSDLQLSQTVRDFYDLRLGQGLDIPVSVIKHFNIQRGMNLFMASEVPPGTGLGSSGTVCVNLVNLFNELEHMKMSKQQIAETAYKIGHDDLGMPIGKQDEYAASFGGLNVFHFTKEGVKVEPLELSHEIRKRLEEDIMLFFTGRTRDSSNILFSQDRGGKEDREEVVQSLHNIKSLGFEIKDAISEGDLRKFGKLMARAWENKKRLAKGISNERIDRFYNTAMDNGAIGAKLTGAGGGGFLMLFCEKPHQKAVRDALSAQGLKQMDFKFDMHGAKIIGGD